MSKPGTSKSNFNDVEGVATLSTNTDTEGFDMQAGETWVYPTNYALREYQYNIIQEVLLKNTMVSLPTGLGKTFIAAVVMYNFFRWYPTGKIIFMAPTRPLVKQQINACYNIMAIPKDATAELTGSKNQTIRKDIWKEKRVFFITPQVLQNDLDILVELGSTIKCVVFDEAHKAKGNHAYCEVIRKLSPQNKYFRVLGLSATPGSTLIDVLGVIRNLLISHLEIRTDDSPDVLPYIFQRSLESVVVPLGEKLEEVRNSYIKILERYTRVLVQHRVIHGNCSMLTKGKIFMTMKDYQEKSRNGRDRAYSEIMRNLNICVTLYHAYELLVRHGLRGFLSFYEEHIDKPLLRGNTDLQQIMDNIREYLGPAPNVEPLPDGTIAEIPESCKFGHPKFYKLRDILSAHFADASNSDTRVIVFCEYRESVMEAYALLLRYKPLIRPKIFLGQGTQRQQINVIKSFKDGECNTLISTCIGEEGLDVGDVDLIVCFDINNKSPIRMVQRMGRTGRKRQGRVVILVTEGKEQETLKECLIHKQNLTNHILQSSALYKEMYAQNPRMVPAEIEPKCHKIYITVTPEERTRKKSNNLKNMFDSISRKKSNLPFFHDDCDINVLGIEDRLPLKQEYWNKSDPLSIEINENKNRIDFSKRLGKLRVLQPIGEIGHSQSSEMLVTLLQFAESKKFNIPISQVPVMPSQIVSPKKTKKILGSDGYKQADIRNMFFKPAGPELMGNTGLKAVEAKEADSSKEMLNKLYLGVASYLTITIEDESICKVCENLFDCSSQFKVPTMELDIKSWVEPDYSIFDSLTVENFNVFADCMSPKSNELYNLNLAEPINYDDYINGKTAGVEGFPNKEDNEFNFAERSITYLDDTFGFKDSPFKPPNSVRKVLKKLDLDDSAFNDVAFTQMEKAIHSKTIQQNTVSVQNKMYDVIPCTFDVKAFDDAEFTQMVPKETIDKPILNELNKSYQDTLTFFNMSTLEELFNDSCTTTSPTTPPQSQSSQDTIVYTPNNCLINNEKNSPQDEGSCSPILCTFDRSRLLKSKAHKRLFETSVQGESKTDTKGKMEKTCGLGKPEIVANHKNIAVDIFNVPAVKNVKPLKPNLSKLLQPAKNTFFKSKRDICVLKNAYDDQDEVEPDVIDTSTDDIFESIAISQVVRKNKLNDGNKPEACQLQPPGDREEIDIDDMFDLSIFGLGDHTKALLSSTHIQATEEIQKHVGASDTKRAKANEKTVDAETRKNNATEFRSKINTITNKQKSPKAAQNNSVQSGASVLNDFCDNSLIDMFFDNNLLETDADREKKNELTYRPVEKENRGRTSATVNNGLSKSKMVNVNQAERKILFPNRECDNFKPVEKDNKLSAQQDNINSNKNVLLPSMEKDNIALDKAALVKNQNLGSNSKVNKEKQELAVLGKHTRQQIGESTNHKEKGWDEDSEWDFCMSWARTEVTSKLKCNAEQNNNKNRNIKNTSPFKLATKKYQSDYEKKNVEFVDLTDEGPECSDANLKTSPTLFKSQRNNIYLSQKTQQNKKPLTQPNMSNYLTKSSDFHMDKLKLSPQTKMKVEQSTRNPSKLTTKAKPLSKLQLNRKDVKSSITSMQWFKNNTGNDTNLVSQRNSKSTSTSISTVAVDVPEIPIVCTSTSSEMEPNDDYNFTFKTKLSMKNNSEKNQQTVLPIPKVSPILNKHKKIINDELVRQANDLDTIALSSNKKSVNMCDTPRNAKHLKVAVVNLDSSDDDFELPSKKTTGWIKPKSIPALENRRSPSVKRPSKSSTCERKADQKKYSGRSYVKKKLEECSYLDLEAEVSSDEGALSKSDDDVDEDKFEESFVDDDTQNLANNTMMHVQYLESVRSPVFNRGKFKIPDKPRTSINVYSQPIDEAENTYVNDSFCVNTEDIGLSQDTLNISELELAELQLEERRNTKKKRKKLDKGPSRKRLRILENSSDSD